MEFAAPRFPAYAARGLISRFPVDNVLQRAAFQEGGEVAAEDFRRTMPVLVGSG